MSDTTTAIRYDVDQDGVCTLTMDLPGKSTNALGAALTTALRDAVERVIADDRVRGAILTSAKPTFVVGGDLVEMDAQPEAAADLPAAAERSRSLADDLRRLELAGKPFVAAVGGTAVGGGLEILLACHHRVVADDPAIRLGLPESRLGLMPGGGGTQRLPRLIGAAAALPLMLEGKLVDPAAALQAGFIDEVVPPAQLHEAAKQWLLDHGDASAPWDRPDFQVPGGSPADNQDVRNLFSGINARLRADTFGNLPAPFAICAAVYEGLQVPFDVGVRIESRYFAQLFAGPVARAMIRTFFIAKQAADKLERRPAHVAATTIERVGILGAGTMGAGLALSAAEAGLEVVLIDTTAEKADRGRDYARQRLERDVSKGRRTADAAERALDRITATDSYDALTGCPIVIEAVFESRDVKRDAISRAEKVLAADAVLASNTSQMPITGLATTCTRPEQFIGMHFFAPAERMPLVEIIRGERTGDGALARALDLAERLRRTPIVVNDGPGFFTSRFIGSFIAESMRMIGAGIDPNLVENGARIVGMPMGAMTISDTIGLDTGYHAATQQAEDAGTLTPDLGLSGVLYRDHGRAGRKSGAGFYDYHDDGTKILWPGLRDLVPRLDEQPSIDEVCTRILYAQLAEGARCFDEGVIEIPADGDLGACLGVGFPAHLGGPFIAMDQIGLPAVVAELDRLADAHGEQFNAPQSLRDMAETGRTYHGKRER